MVPDSAPWFAALVEQTRTVRRYQEERPVARALLEELVDPARLDGSARNCQPRRYMIVTDRAARDRIFPRLAWAGYLSDWPGPGGRGIFGCRIGFFGRSLVADLDIDSGHQILLVLALGYPAETVVLDGRRGNCRYGRDGAGVHHVPKRSLKDALYPPAAGGSR